MRIRPAAVVVLTALSACVAGPALAAVASQGSAPHGPSATTTSPQTIPQTTTTSTLTSTTVTGTSTTTTSTSTTPQLIVCIARERRTLAAALKVRTARIQERQFVSTNGMPQCNYLVARAHSGGPRGKVVVTANVDNGPQPDWRLMRKVVEAGQLFGPAPKGWRAPSAVSGLGPYASWFWNLNQLMALNVGHDYLLTVGVIWHHATKAELRNLAFKAILVYRRIVRLAA